MSFDLNWLLTRKVRSCPVERLLSKVEYDKNGCWNFTGKKDSCGYGVFKIGGRSLGAHKVSYILHKGDFDQTKFEMMHECHNRACINPCHIKVGTHRENMNYPETKGRMVGSKYRLGDNCYTFNLIAKKEGETMLFGSSFQAQKLGLSSGRISQSCNNIKGRLRYRGFRWEYKGTLLIT